MRPIYAVTFLFDLPFDLGLRAPVARLSWMTADPSGRNA
jgi:hypothetical protein